MCVARVRSLRMYVYQHLCSMGVDYVSTIVRRESYFTWRCISEWCAIAAVHTQYMFTYISDINPSIYYSKYCVPEGLERLEFNI
jgi:hypothetical protein